MSRRRRAGTTVNSKGYLRISAGPLRYRYVHRIVAAALLGRELERSEEVHHKDKDRLNPAWNNLLVYGALDHGWVSAKQAWYMRELDIKLKKEWDEFMAEEEKRFDAQIQEAKAEGKPWQNQDGRIAERYERFKTYAQAGAGSLH